MVHGEGVDSLDRLVRWDLMDSVDSEVLLVHLATQALPDCPDQPDPSDQSELLELEDWLEKLEFQATLGLQDLKDSEVFSALRVHLASPVQSARPVRPVHRAIVAYKAHAVLLACEVSLAIWD